MVNTEKWTTWLIGIIVFLGIAQFGLPFLNHALGNLSSDMAGAPLIGLFARNGLMLLIVMAGIVVMFIRGTNKSR